MSTFKERMLANAKQSKLSTETIKVDNHLSSPSLEKQGPGPSQIAKKQEIDLLAEQLEQKLYTKIPHEKKDSKLAKELSLMKAELHGLIQEFEQYKKESTITPEETPEGMTMALEIKEYIFKHNIPSFNANDHKFRLAPIVYFCTIIKELYKGKMI